MAEELQDTEAQNEAVDEAPSGSGKARVLALLAVVVGAVVGFIVVGPAVGGASANEAAEADTAEAASETYPGGGASAPELFSVENMVVNPAGTEGVLRFLMVTVAVEPHSADALARLEANEVVLRDALLRTFALHTTDELLDTGGRSALIAELRGVIEEVVGPGSVDRIFLPQYVIQ